MNCRLSIIALLVLSSSCVSAAANADMSGLPICSTMNKLPKGFRATGDCDRMSPLDSCTFSLQSDGNRISYVVESGIIKSKTFRLDAKTKAPFALSSLDTPKSAKSKVKTATGLSIKQHDDPELYLQSTEKKCTNNVYTISVYFNAKRLAQEVVVSSLPAI
jgi:hypothetical protein